MERTPESLIHSALTALPGWTWDGHALVRSYRFDSFPTAMAFMQVAVADIERLNHHPEWSNVYNRVTVRLTSHDAGNYVTDKDLQLAQVLERLAASY